MMDALHFTSLYFGGESVEHEGVEQVEERVPGPESPKGFADGVLILPTKHDMIHVTHSNTQQDHIYMAYENSIVEDRPGLWSIYRR